MRGAHAARRPPDYMTVRSGPAKHSILGVATTGRLDEEQLSCDLDDGDESDNVLGFDDESDDALLYTDH